MLRASSFVSDKTRARAESPPLSARALLLGIANPDPAHWQTSDRMPPLEWLGLFGNFVERVIGILVPHPSTTGRSDLIQFQMMHVAFDSTIDFQTHFPAIG